MITNPSSQPTQTHPPPPSTQQPIDPTFPLRPTTMPTPDPSSFSRTTAGKEVAEALATDVVGKTSQSLSSLHHLGAPPTEKTYSPSPSPFLAPAKAVSARRPAPPSHLLLASPHGIQTRARGRVDQTTLVPATMRDSWNSTAMTWRDSGWDGWLARSIGLASS